jgi:MarR family 2-MHQ and catechol resistance regulon transcriptional repressor
MKSRQMSDSRRQALNTYVKLMRATNRTTGDIHRHLQEDNLTHSQFAVLEALYHLGPLSQGELGEKILRSNANLTTVVDSLEKKQLVARQRRDSDRRRVTVQLTASGEELIARVFPRHAEIVERRFAILSTAEQRQLAGLLKKLAGQ